MLTFGEVLDRSSIAFPEKYVVTDGERRRSYQELNSEVNKFAGGLVKIGVRRGDRIGLWMQNCMEWVVVWFAAARVGAVIVPLDTWYKDTEVEYILDHSEASTIITATKFGNIEFLYTLNKIRPNLPKLKDVIVVGDAPKDTLSYEKVLEMGRDWRENQEYTDRRFQNNLDDVVFSLYTSGTTGKPKGAMLSHSNIMTNAKDVASIMEISHRDRFLIPVPFSHLFGVLGIALTTVHGASMVIQPGFDPDDVLKAVEKEECSVCLGVPTMFIRELEVLKIREYDTSSLRTGIMAGAPCPIDTMKDVIERMGCDVSIGYGLTEACFVTFTGFGDTIEQRVETVGRSLPHIEVKVTDDDRNEVQIGEMGELACKGYNVMKGYFKDPEQTAVTIDGDGWLYTGDLATIDEDGYVRIVGRKKDLVIVGGFNVYPREVEEFLIEHPKIHEVSVVGVPDHDMGELVAVVVNPKSGSSITGQEVVDYCYEKIASAKVPRYVFVGTNLPISGRGKVQKFILRKQLVEKIKQDNINKLVPTQVRLKQKRETVGKDASDFLESGKISKTQLELLKKFLLTLDEEQEEMFRELMSESE